MHASSCASCEVNNYVYVGYVGHACSDWYAMSIVPSLAMTVLVR